jgi:hypothetical protein
MNPTLQKLKGKSTTTFVTKDSKLGELEWVIRPIPFTLLLENFERFGDVPGKDGDLTPEQAVRVQKSIYPMMKAIIPKCIVEPKITDDDEIAKGEEYLHVDDIPFGSLVDLFNKIVELTGLEKSGEEARKKLQNQPSAKV